MSLATNDEWVARLLWIRAALGLNQTELRKRLIKEKVLRDGVSQSALSRWENGESDVPAAVKRFIERMEKSREAEAYAKEDPEETLHGRGLVSRDYSYSTTIFKLLRKESNRYIKHLVGEFLIHSPEKGFADVEMKLALHGVSAPNDELYLDCLGVAAPITRDLKGTHRFYEHEGSDLKLTSYERGWTKVDVVDEVRNQIGPHALAYKLSNVGQDDDVTLVVSGKRGLRTDALDSVGVPVYADYLVERLTLRVRFEGVVPENRVVPQVYLLRRTPLGSRPMNLDNPLNLRILEKSSHEYSLIGLQRPKAGWGYCIAWKSLTKSAKR